MPEWDLGPGDAMQIYCYRTFLQAEDFKTSLLPWTSSLDTFLPTP